MSNQFFEERPSEMGLFTFYKKQQENDEPNRSKAKRGKKRKGQHKKKLNGLPSSPDIRQERSVDKSDHSDSCYQFLKSIRPKIKRLQLQEVSEITVNEHQEEKIVTAKEESPRLVFKEKEQSPLQQKAFQPIKKILAPLKQKLLPQTANKLSTSLLPSSENSNIFMQKELQSLNSPSISKKMSRQLVKKRIRTEVNNQLHKNSYDYINSAERQLIICKKLAQPQPTKKESATFSKKIRQKTTLHQEKNNAKRSFFESETSGVIQSKSTKLQHEKNKHYFNHLIENLSVQPQYNQTVYRILRQTLIFPQLARSSYRYIKTETTSPLRIKRELQIRSQSKCKKAVLEEGVKQRQKKWKGGLMSVIAKSGVVISK